MNEERYPISAASGSMPLSNMTAPQAPPPAALDAGASINVAGLIGAFRRRWWLVAICAVLGAAGAVAMILRTSPVYESHAVVEVAQGKLRILKDIEELEPEDLSHLEVLKTIEQSFGSNSLNLRIAEACDLRSDPDFQVPGGAQYSDAQLAGILGSMISATLRRGTRLIDIVVRDTDPERAQQLAESVVQEYTRWEIEQGRALVADAQSSLGDEAQRLRAELERSESELLAYREKHRAMSLEGRELMLDEKAKALNVELAKTKAERLRLEADLDQIADSGGAISGAAALALPSVAARPEIVALRGKVSEKRSEFAMTKKRYGFKHPTYINVQSEMEELADALSREASIAAESLRNTSEALADKESKLEGELAAQREELLQLAGVLRPYKSLVREVESNRAMFDGVSTRLKEAVATGAVERASITMKQSPLAASYPVAPRKKVYLALGLIAGCALGVGLVLAGEILNPSFRTASEAERSLAMPLLAALPRTRGGSGGLEPGGELGDAYRSMRTSLAFVGRGTHARKVLFTSARDGDGAPECAANCAAAFARQGFRTLLVDADLASPSLDQMVRGQSLPDGLAKYLTGDSEPMKVVNETPVENLYLLPGGAAPVDSGALLADDRLGELIRESLRWFHRIVINAAPLEEGGDGLLVARHADSVCLVVEAGVTPRREVLRACSLLTMAGSPPVGFVLSGAERDRKRAGRRGNASVRRRQVLQEA